MAENQEYKEGWIQRLRKKVRIVGMDPLNFQEKWGYTTSPLTVLSLLAALILLVSIGTYLLIAETALSEYIFGSAENDQLERAIRAEEKVEMLEEELIQQRKYWDNLRDRLLNEEPPVPVSPDSLTRSFDSDTISVAPSAADSLLRDRMEESLDANSSLPGAGLSGLGFDGLFFYRPLDGVQVVSFDPGLERFGIGIRGKEGSLINATLDGTVLHASWTPDNGHVVYMQHANELVSVYKNCSRTLVKEGEKVRAGAPVAVIGPNSDEVFLVYFELWQQGSPIDPSKFLKY